MKIVLANPRGFCAGVEMAIESLQRALTRFGPPLYVFHEIVHNKHVVQQFEKQGVVFVESVDGVPPGSHLLYSAHGVSPEVRRQAEQRGLHAIDATCPLVTKVHREAIRFSSRDFTIVLIGHAGHEEIMGTIGEAPERTRLVETREDVDRLDVPDPRKVAYLTQTTLSIDDAGRIIDRLKERFPQIVGPPSEDICFATQNRQEAVKVLLPEVDLALVVGSSNSSNSNRLVEIALEAGIPAYLIDGPDDIDPDWFQGDETVLMTAGASAPEEAVRGCIQCLRDRYGATVEQRTVREEHAVFPIPLELRGREVDSATAVPEEAANLPARVDR